jgi:hypothetical protein
MPDRPPPRLVPPWAIALLLPALVVLMGATGQDEGSAGGGLELGSLALLLVGVLAAAILVLAAGYLVLRWRAGPAPAEVPGDWWTCAACGAANIGGSPRCHACGAWPH